MTTPVTTAGRLPVSRYSTTGEAFSEATGISSSVVSAIFKQTDDGILKDTHFDLTYFNNPTFMTAMVRAQQASVPATYEAPNPVTWYYAPEGVGRGLPLRTMTAWITSVTATRIHAVVTGDCVTSIQ